MFEIFFTMTFSKSFTLKNLSPGNVSWLIHPLIFFCSFNFMLHFHKPLMISSVVTSVVAHYFKRYITSNSTHIASNSTLFYNFITNFDTFYNILTLEIPTKRTSQNLKKIGNLLFHLQLEKNPNTVVFKSNLKYVTSNVFSLIKLYLLIQISAVTVKSFWWP